MALFVNVSEMVVVFGLFVIFVWEVPDPLGGKVKKLVYLIDLSVVSDVP